MRKHSNARSCANCRAVMHRLVESGQSVREVSNTFGLSPRTVYKWLRRRQEGGLAALENRSSQPRRIHRKYPLPSDELTLFGVLHSPPSEHGLNRTTWRIGDLVDLMKSRGHRVNVPMVSELIWSGGYRWKRHESLLTSNDTKFREKLDRVQIEQ